MFADSTVLVMQTSAGSLHHVWSKLAENQHAGENEFEFGTCTGLSTHSQTALDMVRVAAL